MRNFILQFIVYMITYPYLNPDCERDHWHQDFDLYLNFHENERPHSHHPCTHGTTLVANIFGSISLKPWWRHQMETFSALLAICAGNSPIPGEFPTQRPVTQSFDVFFDLRLNKRLSKQSWGWWIETLSRPLWRHRNDIDLRRTWLISM